VKLPLHSALRLGGRRRNEISLAEIPIHSALVSPVKTGDTTTSVCEMNVI
jgi:hypothetical protein